MEPKCGICGLEFSLCKCDPKARRMVARLNDELMGEMERHGDELSTLREQVAGLTERRSALYKRWHKAEDACEQAEEQVEGLRGLLRDARNGLADQPELDTDAIIRGIDAALAPEPESAAGVKVGRYAVHEEDEGAQEPEPPAPEPECGAEDCPVPPVPGTNYCHAHTGGSHA